MKKLVISAACCGVLMSCSSGDVAGPESFVPTPERFAGSGEIAAIPSPEDRYLGKDIPPVGPDLFAGNNNVTSMSYDPDSQVLTILGDPFDLAGTFRRAPARDVRGFAAFENEGGARNYLALVRTDVANGLAAGVVGTPFRLNTEFGGGVLARDVTPTLPTNREIRHLGDYAAVRNEGTNDGDDMSNSFLHRVEGQVKLDLDFFADRNPGIEGVIINRRNMDATTTRQVAVEVEVKEVLLPGQSPRTTTEIREIQEEITYEDIVLVFTDIGADGYFLGGASSGGSENGSYFGTISGNNAAGSAGLVVITSPTGALERGAFIARRQD